jgi:3-isopropylmalate/(R)-2-methylmalate dehydratase small subunit
MQPVEKIESQTVVLPTNDIDTDQIIPARFLTTTSREGLGAALFHDLRFDNDGGENPDFVLNKPEASGCRILVGGNNFGCGSSREHAPWALLDFGFRAVISSKIADIFGNNSLKNGLLPIVIDQATHTWLLDHPGADLVIDVTQSTLELPSGRVVSYPIDDFARYCLVEGIDQLDFLQQYVDAIKQYEETRPWTP